MDNPISKLHFTYGEFMKEAHQAASSAEDVVKAAKDQQAMTGIKDPADKGETSIPSFGDGANRSKLGLPENQSNLSEADKQHNIMSETKPNGVGEGEYITPQNGTKQDATVTSPISKIAGIGDDLRASIEASKSAATAALYGANEQKPTTATKENTEGQNKEAAKTPAGAETESPAPAVPAKTVSPEPGKEPTKAMEAAVEKPASADSVNMPLHLADDADLMSKLASIGMIMIGTEEGQRAVQTVLEKEAGLKECRNFIAGVHEELSKQAGVKEPSGYTYGDFRQMAMAKKAHTRWMETLKTDFEKQAYQAGAADGAAAAEAMAAGGEPTIPGAGDITADDLMAYLQALVQAQQITPQEAEALMQELAGVADDGISQDEIVAGLQAKVDAGEITDQDAAAILQAYAQGGQQVAAGDEAAAAAAAENDPVAEKAASDAMNKAASVVSELWSTPAQTQEPTK